MHIIFRSASGSALRFFTSETTLSTWVGRVTTGLGIDEVVGWLAAGGGMEEEASSSCGCVFNGFGAPDFGSRTSTFTRIGKKWGADNAGGKGSRRRKGEEGRRKFSHAERNWGQGLRPPYLELMLLERALPGETEDEIVPQPEECTKDERNRANYDDHAERTVIRGHVVDKRAKDADEER